MIVKNSTGLSKRDSPGERNRFEKNFFREHPRSGFEFARISESIALRIGSPILMPSKEAAMSFRIAAVIFAGWALLAPQQTLAQGQPLITLGPCSGGYFPVCAVKKRVLVTYVNSCAARSAGARVISDHGCQDSCPRNYAPVCATDAAGHRRTFGNACEAERAGAKIVRGRGCRGLLGRR